ncbi:MAG TPA: hypothetical protein VEK12_10090 [Alphaproteobacteria bacterium]|nr:hypothetical protein [Alphaproteobacteria bacterium]
MNPTTEINHGLPAEAAGMTGREVRRAITDGKVPARRTSTITLLGGAK